MITLFAHTKGVAVLKKAAKFRTRKSAKKKIIVRRKATTPKKRVRVIAKNPVKHGYTIVAGGAEIATFKTRMHAVAYGQALANQLGKTVSLRK